MKKIYISILMGLVTQILSWHANAQTTNIFDYSINQKGFTDQLKSNVHIIMLAEPSDTNFRRCVSQEMVETPTYRTIALMGALVTEDHFKATKITPYGIAYTKPENATLWRGLKFQRVMKRESLNDIDVYNNNNCVTYILLDEDYPPVRDFLRKAHRPTKGKSFYFEKSFTFDEVFSAWVKYLGYSNPDDYVNGFMRFNVFVNEPAYRRFVNLGLSDYNSIKLVIDRANSVSYPLLTGGGFDPDKLFEFVRDETIAKRDGKNLRDVAKARQNHYEDIDSSTKNPHILRCGANIDCGDPSDIVNKTAQAVIKLAEAAKPNGQYSYRSPLSETDKADYLNKCNKAYIKIRSLSLNNVGDLMGQRDMLLGQCNGLWQLKY